MPERDATLGRLLAEASRELGGGAGGRIEAEVLLGAALGVGREWIYMHDREHASADAADRFAAMVGRRLRTRCPVALLVGRKEFMGLPLRMECGVFIPRPETEGLVELAIEWLAGRPGGEPLADVGCGSGAIAVTLALGTGRRVYATDIAGPAIALTTCNAHACGAGRLVTALQGRWLEPLEGEVPARGLGAVVSNPPYIPGHVLPELPPDVREYDPAEALDGGIDGLDAIRKLAEAAAHWLAPGGLVALEIGADQGEAVGTILAGRGWSGVRMGRDLAGNTRYCLAIAPR